MRKLFLTLGVCAGCWCATPAIAQVDVPLVPAWDYQGQLVLGGVPVDGTADFRLQLWNAAAGGAAITGVISRNCVMVNDGLFTLNALNFGVNPFNGEEVFLEIAVRSPCGGGLFTTLAPRTRVAPTPYALQTRGLFVDNALNVGIGTTAPGEKLQVEGNLLVTGENLLDAGANITVNDGDGDPGVVLSTTDSGTANNIQVYRDGVLGTNMASVSDGYQNVWRNTDFNTNVLAGGISSPDASGFWEVYDGDGIRTVWLDADNDQNGTNGVSAGALQVRSRGTGGPGGELNIQNNDGVQTVQVLGGTSGNGSTATFSNGNTTTPVDTVSIFGDSGDGGLIQLSASNNSVTVQIDGDSADGGVIFVENDASSSRLTLDGDNSDAGSITVGAADGSSTVFLWGEGDNSGGLASVRNDISEATVEITGDDGDDTGRITLLDRNAANNFTSLLLDGVDAAGTGSEILMYDNEGDTATIELNGDNGVSGSETGELTIRETDGSSALRFLGCDLNLYNAAGSSTINWDRCTGTKSAVVDTPGFGQRKMYCVESTEVWFEDFGSGQLVNGEARIQLDPMFLQTITVDEANPLKVFVTLTDDCQGVFVRKGADHFLVKELAGGRSNATFDYRIVAKRFGTEHLRMEEFIDAVDSDAAFVTTPTISQDGVEGELEQAGAETEAKAVRSAIQRSTTASDLQ